MAISNKILNLLKAELKQGNLASAINVLSTTNDPTDLTIFREHKLLLFSRNNSELIKTYRQCALRLLRETPQEKYELNYLAFLEHYIKVKSQLRDGIKDSLTPFLDRSLKDFLVLSNLQVRTWLTWASTTFHANLVKHAPAGTSSPNTEFFESAYHSLQGKVSDMLFATSNLLNLFSEWGIPSEGKGEFMGLGSEEETHSFMTAIYLTGHINSYQYAFDKLSYGEWEVETVELHDKPLFKFKIIDTRLEIARDLGLKRILAQHALGRRRKRWLREFIEEYALDSLKLALTHYSTELKVSPSFKLFKKAKKRLFQSLDQLDAEDELLVGINMDVPEVLASYLTVCTLITYSVAAEALKEKFQKNTFYLTCPQLPIESINHFLDSVKIVGKQAKYPVTNFFSDLPLSQFLDLFKSPFVKDKDGAIYAVDYLSQDGWPKWVRSNLIQGGPLASKIGKAWEGYVASVLRDHKWEIWGTDIELKENGKTLTDIDILVQKGHILYIIQMKVFYGNGINQYEQWKYRKKLIEAVDQTKVALNYINNDLSRLLGYIDPPKGLFEIKKLVPVVMTNYHMFNGWKHEGVSVLSTGALMQILNGANVKFRTLDGKVLGEQQFGKSKVLDAEEVMEFIEYPLDWRMAEPTSEIHYHVENLEDTILHFPQLKRKHDAKESNLFSN